MSKVIAVMLMLAALTLQNPVMASDTSSAIRGQVVDASGVNQANVTVEITHQPTGTTKTVTTTQGGVFQARGLTVGGPYTIKVTAGSSLTFVVVDDLVLQLGQTSKVVLSEKKEQEIERILVTGQLAMAGTYKKGPSQEFSEQDIANTAAISRDLKSILKSDSRMVVDNTADGGPALSIAGGSVRGNSLTVDGVKQNDDFGLNKNGYPGRRTPISLDAIEQLAVNVAPFEVTYGDFQGGNVNIVTKSGSNEIHGTAFYYRSEDSFAGEDSKGEDLNIGEFEEDTYGFTLGGPIIEDQLFFFVAYEKFDATKPYQFTLDNENGVAEANEKMGVTQADFNNIAQIAQTSWNYDIGDYTTSAEEEDEKLLLKLDWYINDDHRASFTYQDNEGNTVRDYWAETFPNETWATAESNRYNMNETLTAYSLQIFSDWNEDFSSEFKFARKEVETEQVPLLGANFAQFLIHTPGGGSLYIGPDQFRHANALTNDRDMFKLKGDYYLTDEHLLTFGIEHEILKIENTFVFGSLGMTEFASIDDFQNNIGLHVFQNAITGDVSDAIDKFEYTTTTVYLQDEWSVTDDITLTYGFRFTEYSNDDKPVLNDNFVTRHGYDNQNNYDGLDLFEPRFGINWTYDDDTVIRAGIGLFGGGAPNVWLSNSYGNDGIRKTFALCNSEELSFIGFPVCDFDGHTIPDEILTGLASGGGNGDTNSIAPNFEIPSTWKLNFGIERRQDLGFLGEGWLLTADVIFSQVKDAALYEELNMVPAVDGDGDIKLAPDGRPIYDSPAPFDLSLTNTDEGEGQVWTIAADKNFYTDHGNYTFSIGYTYQDITEINPGNAFVAFEGYSMPANDDFQAQTEYNSEYEVQHRFTVNLSWSNELFGNNLTTVALSFTAREGRHFSHTMRSDGTFGGFAGFATWDGYNSQSFYVPSGMDDPLVTYADDFDTAAFFDYIDSTDCLSSGKISRRHACSSRWIQRLDFHLMQEIHITGEHKLELSLDIENLGNLLNDDWGRAESYVQPFNAPVVDVTINDNGQYVYSNFTEPTPTLAKIPSVWKAQLGIRYRF